jgi:hypothetical protein
MTAISRSKTKIWIVAADTVPSTLTYSATADIEATDKGYFKGDISSYSKSGGEKEVESQAVFGGYVDKEKPTSQIEVSLEIVPLLDATKADRWDFMAYAKDVANAGIYTSASETSTQPDDRMIVIEAASGALYKTVMYNNCNVTVLDLEHNADDNRTYNMTLKFSPTDDNGVANSATSDIAATAMPAFSALDNN